MWGGTGAVWGGSGAVWGCPGAVRGGSGPGPLRAIARALRGRREAAAGGERRRGRGGSPGGAWGVRPGLGVAVRGV